MALTFDPSACEERYDGVDAGTGGVSCFAIQVNQDFPE